MKEEHQVESKSGNGKTFAIVFMVLVVVAALLFAFLAYASRAKILAELKDTQGQLDTSRNINAQLQTQLETMRTANSNAHYIMLPELGVRIPKTAELQNVIAGIEDTANPNQPFAHFSSGEILTAVMSNPAGPYSLNQCALSDSPLGIITRYSPGSTVKGAKVETLVEPSVKKVGDYFFVYTNVATACTSNKTVFEIITAQQQKFAEAFANLEPIAEAGNQQ